MVDRLNLTGSQFGSLVVIGPAGAHKGKSMWNCRCACGAERIAKGTSLTHWQITSCGCGNNYAHNVTHGMSNSPTYRSWAAMKVRCLNSNHYAFHRYGGRGVSICNRWLTDFATFLSDMGERPPGTTLDRYPNKTGNYEPGNCRWATPTEQARNMKTNLNLTFNGETKCMKDFAHTFNIKRTTLGRRLAAGWSVERALLEPIHNNGRRVQA